MIWFLARVQDIADKYQTLTQTKTISNALALRRQERECKYRELYDQLYDNLFDIEMESNPYEGSLTIYDISDEMLANGPVKFIMNRLSTNDRKLLKEILQTVTLIDH